MKCKRHGFYAWVGKIRTIIQIQVWVTPKLMMFTLLSPDSQFIQEVSSISILSGDRNQIPYLKMFTGK